MVSSSPRISGYNEKVDTDATCACVYKHCSMYKINVYAMGCCHHCSVCLIMLIRVNYGNDYYIFLPSMGHYCLSWLSNCFMVLPVQPVA